MSFYKKLLAGVKEKTINVTDYVPEGEEINAYKALNEKYSNIYPSLSK